MSKPSETPEWATNGGTTVEPLLAQKQAGWANAFKPPARWFNWWMNLVYQWCVWLDLFESTAHTWTATQTLQAGAVVSNTGAAPAIDATGNASAPAINAKGIAGALGTNASTNTGGSGTISGGSGTAGIGGFGSAANATGGPGGTFTGGAGGDTGTGTGGKGVIGIGGSINGLTNTAGAAGPAGKFVGGDVASDANGRKGGDALVVTGGNGQAGRGRALYADHGDITLDDGVVNAGGINAPGGSSEFGDVLIDDELTVTHTATFNGPMIASAIVASSILMPAVVAITPLLNSPYGANVTPNYWKSPLGEVGMQGSLSLGGAATGTSPFTIPAGFRPLQTASFLVCGDSGGGFATISILTTGVVIVAYVTGFTGPILLDGIRYRTT